MKRGQFEAMGLAIIVLLLSLGMLMLLFFSLREPSDAPDRYRDQQLAQSVVDALLATSVQDCSLDVAGLIEDTVTLQRNPCGEESKVLLEQITTAALAGTLDIQEYHYAFLIREDLPGAQDGPPIFELSKSCTVGGPISQQTERPGMQPITVYPTVQTYLVLLYLCDT